MGAPFVGARVDGPSAQGEADQQAPGKKQDGNEAAKQAGRSACRHDPAARWPAGAR